MLSPCPCILDSRDRHPRTVTAGGHAACRRTKTGNLFWRAAFDALAGRRPQGGTVVAKSPHERWFQHRRCVMKRMPSIMLMLIGLLVLAGSGAALAQSGYQDTGSAEPAATASSETS